VKAAEEWGTSVLPGARAVALSDNEITDLLVAGAPEAHRLASWLLRDQLAAEDAVQEAALAAWKSRARLRNADNPSGWFNTIVVNVCRDELRRRARQRELPPTARAIDPPHDRLAVREEIGRAIGRLTPDEQVVVGLRFGRDLSGPQIAELLRVPEGTVKSRLHHSLEHLRAALAAERRLEEPRP
jgi:RNA polymerase sigma-70 factor (ECF subfamily)